MAIRLVEDVGAPLVVVAADLFSETAAPAWNEPLSYVAAIGGYLGAGMGFGGPFIKNIGIASLPWAAKKLYTRVRTMMPAASMASRMTFRPAGIARYPAPQEQSPFQGVKLV